MLFSNKNPIKKQTMKQAYKKRKEKDSFLAICHMSKTSIITHRSNNRVSPELYSERAPLCTSFQSSITVEAAMIIPIFFFALLALLYLLEMMALQMSVRMGLQYAAQTIAEDLYSSAYVSTSRIEQLVLEGIDSEKLEESIVVAGSNGIDCSESTVSTYSGVIELIAKYSIELPLPQIGLPSMNYEESIRVKGWTGYQKSILSNNETMVYITDNASVYHTDYNCTHLQLSIHRTSASEVEQLRNEYGSRYTPCSECIKEGKELQDMGTLYIAETGDRYHESLSCSGLKRTIYTMPLSEVVGKGVCSRCGL